MSFSHDVVMFNAFFFFLHSAFRLISLKFVFQLTNVLAILNAHCVDPEIIKQVFRQVWKHKVFNITTTKAQTNTFSQKEISLGA